ncbi:MAG TPA: hypothetical protein VJZ71_08635 [Phycisphaerae bacterium]|nr:hypothetical protein [Phycisphaerae bacterium]
MLRKLPLYAICLFAAAPFACTKSEDDLRPAQRAAGGLMPDTDPKFEAEYVADQSQVKLVAPRTVSYEPLDTFRGKAEPAAKADAPADAEPAKSTARAAPGPRGTPSAPPSAGGGNFWSRVGMKALMGGGAAPPGPPPASPGQPAPKEDEPAAEEEAADNEDATEEEEADADEEEPAEDEEADSDEEESEDEGSEEEPKEDTPDKEPKDTDNRD